MNIILFCRILSVDFSGVLSASYKAEWQGFQPRALVRYLRSLAKEDKAVTGGDQSKKMAQD